jgi:hypothetical protein
MERLIAALERNTEAQNAVAGSVNDLLVVIEQGLDEDFNDDPLFPPALHS